MVCVRPENEVEQTALEKFKHKTADLDQDDETLLRFLRARDLDLRRAEEMLRTCITWRKEMKADCLPPWSPSPILKEKFNIYYDHAGYDKEGRPVFYIPLGDFQAMECIEHGLKDEMLTYPVYAIEHGISLMKDAGVSTIVGILDMAKLRMKQIIHIESMMILYNAFQTWESNYPERLKTVYIVNAPWIFTMAFNFFKPILGTRTISKLVIYGSNQKVWKHKMLEKIPEKTFNNISFV